MATTNKIYASTYEKHDSLSISNVDTDYPEEEVLELISWIQQTGFATGIVYTTEEGLETKTTLRFRLSGTYQQHYPLLRGYLAMGNNNDIRTDNFNKSFIIEIRYGRSAEASTFVKKIFQWFKDEMKFKSSLKAIKNYENKLKAREQRLYLKLKRSFSSSTLMNSDWN